jgi:cytidyltransferase-like protein
MGGVAGHMAHLSEDTDLTFSEIVDILGKVANAEIANATEKVDGQNLFLSWTIDPSGEVEVVRAGDARTARNAGDIKKGGMTTDEYISKWTGHPAESAFTNGFKAISTALRGLSPDDLEAIFANGQRYVNMEIMYPGNPNIILYSAPNVVLHGLQDFGEDEVTPEMRQLTKQKFTKLVSLVDGAVEKVGNENWNIHGPKLVALKKLADGSALEDVTSKVQSFAAPVGMDATVGDYVELVVRKYTEQVNLPSDITEKLVTLMLNPDMAKEQGITVVKLKKGLPKELQSTVSTLGSKTKSRKYIASVLKPLEVAISDFAIEVLRGVKSYFVSDNDEEVARMRTELEQSIAYLKNLQASGDEKMGELVDQQLAKLGDIENLASSMEGVVFEYPPGSDKIYKLTGAFAMANQIIGRARRSGMTEEGELEEEFDIDIIEDNYDADADADDWYELRHQMDQELGEPIEDESDDPVVDADHPKTIAVVPGAFKPPHKGHLDMVRKYANMADEVVVIISKPTKQGRYLPGGREITSEDSLKIWKVLAGDMPNVRIEASKDHASPVTAAYDFIGEEGPLNVGDEVILGCSEKDCDWQRWTEAEKYVKDGVDLVPPRGSAVVPTTRDSGEPYSATDFRNALGDVVKNRREIAEFVGEENVDAVLDILDLSTVDENSSMAGGGVAIGSGPLASGSDKPAQRDTKKKKKKQYIDLGLLAEVMELIKVRGNLNETK